MTYFEISNTIQQTTIQSRNGRSSIRKPQAGRYGWDRQHLASNTANRAAHRRS